MPGHPQLVAHRDARARPDLVLPLGRHHLRVDARDLDAGEEAGAVVRLHELAPDRAPRSRGAVVRPLRPGVAILRPPEGPLRGGVEEGVLLLDAEPWLLQTPAHVSSDQAGCPGGTRLLLPGSPVPAAWCRHRRRASHGRCISFLQRLVSLSLCA